MSVRTVLVPLAALAALLTACSSSGGGTPPSSRAGSSPAGANQVAISVTSGHLVGPGGRTLYVNSADTATHLVCTGPCLSAWPPVTGTAQPAPGLKAADFGTARRSDGTVQVTFDGHPLYEFAQDTAAGDTRGAGIKDAGGTWSPATPGGGATAPAPTTSASTSNGYG